MKDKVDLAETLARLAAAVADYEAFVRTTRSYELACEGARDAVLDVARAELAFKQQY
jgi:hypothetical protein